MNDRLRVRIYELKTKHCHVESRDASEGEAAVVMETVKARNGWGFVALITPEEEASGKAEGTEGDDNRTGAGRGVR